MGPFFGEYDEKLEPFAALHQNMEPIEPFDREACQYERMDVVFRAGLVREGQHLFFSADQVVHKPEWQDIPAVLLEV